MIARLADILGLDVQAVGRSNLERAAARCMERLGLDAPECYPALLECDPFERRRLFGTAVVQETWFFRDREPFTLLESMAREVFSKQSPATGSPLRLLSVPCATGEEPYSMALTLLRAGLSPENFCLDAVDAHVPALEIARLGRFGPGSFRHDLGPFASFFRPEGQEMVLDERVRKSVQFFEGNILDPDFLRDAPQYGLIFCRNLLVYLTPTARCQVAQTLKRLLAPGGLVFTGLAELPVLAGLGFTPTGHPRALACAVTPQVGSAPPALSGLGPQDVPQAGEAGSLGRVPAKPTWSTLPDGQGFPLISPRPGSTANAASSQQDNPPPSTDLTTPRALADAGHYEEALAMLKGDAAALPPSAEHFHLLGVTLLALHREQEAEDALRKAIYLDPGHAAALTHLELLHTAEGRLDAASRMAGRAKRASGGLP